MVLVAELCDERRCFLCGGKCSAAVATREMIATRMLAPTQSDSCGHLQPESSFAALRVFLFGASTQPTTLFATQLNLACTYFGFEELIAL